MRPTNIAGRVSCINQASAAKAFHVHLSRHFLLLLLIIGSTQNTEAAQRNPLKDPKICGRPQCEAETAKFGYTDTLYKYDYTVKLRTEFSGTGENSSDLFLKANIELLFPKPCEGFLRINEVKLWETDDPSVRNSIDKLEENESLNSNSDDYYGEFEASSSGSSSEYDFSSQHSKAYNLDGDLKKFVLRFAFHDGLISEVCPSAEETPWVLNFKKGILSSFQNTMLRFDVDFNTTETDVFGQCNVHYSLEGTDNVFVRIRKVKDIASCRQRYSTQSILQSTPYTFRDDKTIWPILDSESYCNMTIDNSIYREISCHERHQLIPFSNSSTGAVTTLSSLLEFKGEDSYSSSEFMAQNNELIEKRSTLLFDHTPAVKPTHSEIATSRDLLKRMCEVGYPNIQREFIDVFTSFLQTAKHLDYNSLKELLAHSDKICKSGKDHVLESLPYIGSTASYQVMRDEIIGNKILPTIAHSWMTSLSFIRYPDEETLETFYTILEFSQKKADPEYTLGASAVIHSFCRNNVDCAQNERVKRIVNLLETEFLNLFNMYRGKRQSRERMIVILKGLGNIGVISPEFAAELQEIIENDNLAPIDVRLQAVQAFRRADCFEYRKFFLKTYGNFSLNSEIRIFSYLQAMRCPDYKSIAVIKKTLELEEINQVGSFVWSHLKNLAKSSSPVRIEAQGLLLNDDLSDKFNLDIRKFSRNYEYSLFFDEYNFGTTTDMNLIFGTESYLPRMASFNFTADLFGQSVNFFELSARAEGFEELVASFFGPKGPLNREAFRKKLSYFNRWLGNESSEDDDTLSNLINLDGLRLKRDADEFSEKKDEFEDDYDFEEELGGGEKRSKRSPSSSSESRKQKLQKDVDDLGYKLKYDYNNPRAQIGMRVFGNDLRYYSLEGLLELMILAKNLDPFEQIAKVLYGNEFVYTKSRVFLDASYNVPLGIGIPLAVHAFGASSIDLRISGNLKRMEPVSDSWNFDVEGRFKPSVSVDIITTMQSDLFYTQSGIKVKSNLYSNSEVEAKLKVRGKELVSFSFNLPQDNNEIFSARSELLVVKGDVEIPQTGIQKRHENTTCTWPVLDEAIGLKVCSFFSVPDLSHSSDVIYPGLLLSGPLNFSVVLTKSDLTAKKYVFEYQFEQQSNNSDWSLVFHTPGSEVQRVLVMNVTTEPEAFNASVSFIKGSTRASAGCTYNGNPDDRKLDFFLDTNGNRSLHLNMELQRVQDRTAWVYKPKVLLVINGAKITGLIGTVRINEKNGISQTDFDISFETKKLQVLMRGNLVQNEVTTSTSTIINYRFQANKIETINFDARLTNTGDHSKTEYRANVQLKTSAYPKLNFASNGTWLSLQGHTEGLLTYNNAPNLRDPQYTSLMRLVFARSYSEDLIWEGSRTRASFEIKVPRSRVDFRISVKHEERSKNGTEHNILLGLRYAPDKEATGLFSIHLPRRNLFAVDAYVNVTIPEFNSCVVTLKVIEKASKDYNINFNGSWFTGHSLGIKGNYKDRSSRVQSLHHLKLIVESPSFESTSLNVVYRRNQLIIFADVQAKYGQDPYGLTLQYAANTDDKNTNAELRLKVKEKIYWINAKLLADRPKLLQIEIHIDKIRDIHVKLGLLSLEIRKELSLELKWDANRDPSQRLGLLAEYNSPGNKKYDGNVMVTYPDRTISCGFDIHSAGPKYYGTARASWSVNEIILFKYDIGIMPTMEIHNWINAELLTPFPGWQKNTVRAGVYNKGNLILANTTLLWADNQLLELGYKSDYEIEEPLITFDVRFGINSTVKDIPTIRVKVKHLQDLKKFDTELGLHYTGTNDTSNTYNLKSNWELFKNQHFHNVSGTMLMITPFDGYRKGGLAAKFSLSDDRNVRGAASLNFDIREFTLAMDGYVRKYTDNMLIINITTPLEKFRTIHGRFGLNEKQRHAVAEVRAPTVALGAEILCDIKTLMDFDVRLSVATPVEQFKQAALFAKLKPDTADMRGILNNVTLGFTGVWRMENVTNFEYSYKVFTPLPSFEENGFIIKFVKSEEFILHLHGKLSQYKVGVLINGHPKSKLLNQLGGNKIELEILYDDDFHPPKEEDLKDYDFNDVDYDEFFSYFVDFEVDTLAWPTIDGSVDIQEIMDFFLIIGNLHLPQGSVNIKDRLYYPDYINVLNVLNVKTPFDVAKELKSIVEYHIDLDLKFLYERIHFILSDRSGESKEMGFELNYTKVEDTLKPQQHNAKFTLKTPYETLRDLEVAATVELEENIYRGNISSRTAHTLLSVAASVETEENFLETSVGILLNTNVIPHYGCNAYFKKDFSDIDNSIDLQFEVTDNDVVNKLQLECAWRKNRALIDANGKVRTTMLPLKLAETSILVIKEPNPTINIDLGLLSRSGYRIDYGTRASKKKDVFNVEIWTPLKNFRNISMHGSIVAAPTNPRELRVSGHLYRSLGTYMLNGIIRMSESNYPLEARIRVQPKAGGRDGVIEWTINELGNGQSGVNFQFSAIEDGKMCQVSGGFSMANDKGIDFSALVQSTEPEIARININGKWKAQAQGQVIGEITLETPWKELGIDSVNLRSDMATRNDGGHLLGEYRIGNNIGRGSCKWSWLLAENMQLILESYVERPDATPRIVHASAKYVNPERNYQNLEAGGKLSVDSKWNLDFNGKLGYKHSDDVQLALVAQLPKPVGDVHELNFVYRGNLITKQGVNPNVFFEGQYQSQEAQRKFLTRVSYENTTNLQGLGHVEWGVAQDTQVVEGDFQMLRTDALQRDFYAKVTTPKYVGEPTVYVSGNYHPSKAHYQNFVCSLDYPASRRIADVDLAFQSLSNLHGQVNSSTPFLNVTWFKTDFNFTTTGSESYRYLRGTWPSDTAYFKLHSTYSSQEANRNLNGNIETEVPLATRHRADITYGLVESENNDMGNLKVIYNEKQVLNGLYKRITEDKHPHHIETTDISLENDLKPIGVHYINRQDLTDPAVNVDIKHVEVFELRNTENFNLTGELHTHSRLNGQDFKIVAIHPNRTVVLTTHYDEVDEHLVKQSSKLELSPTAWIGYNIEIGNYTTHGNESQNFVLELFYPKRKLSSHGRYFIMDDRFQSNVVFKWTDIFDEWKSVDTGLRWQAEPLGPADRDHQTLLFTLSHPYLEKEVTIKGLYYRGLVELLKAHMAIDYSNDPNHMINIGAILEDRFRDMHHTLYSLKFVATHPASELDVKVNASVIAKPSYYKAESLAHYKREYFPEKHGKFLALLDINKREVEYIRNTPYHSVRFWAIPNVHYPVYGINATIWDTPETNNTGYIFIDVERKLARMDFNLTEDASQNLQMVGYIPDTRSGYFDIWRNYEEIRIIDVTSYLKMNHSRLVTGRFHWRPKIKDEVKAKINAVGTSIYNSFSDGIDFWIKSMYTESVETMGVVWEKTKEYNERFFDDIAQLSVLEEDLEDLRLFVNQSYEANDFYIKTVVNFTLTILDELAIRDHIQSLPKIFTEIWQAMGDSGKALRKSIVWLIDAIKTTYNNILDAISRFFHGESLHYLSALMEKGVEKYDKFVKELHIKFIKYFENLWNKFWNILSNYWKSVLKRLEPHIFKFVSYIETAAWNLSKEVFDFIYKRTNELAESPYFNKVSSFTQDVDRLYRDIKSNDAITNIKKYSLIAWNFIKEKYFKLVPFGTELNEVLTEIWEEIKELEKVEQVQIVLVKYNELMAKLDWLAEELDIETRLHQLYALVRNKIRNYAMNAIETDDMYREAKTKFIFDPEVGIIDLEQKLPMSWHAFNETPKFEEIPEYKFLAQAQNVFSTTNSSIVRYIYNLRSHLDPKTWLPPYYSRALLIDSRHYMTFDHRFVGLNLLFEERSGSQGNAQCSYLLAHDFFHHNFTLMLEPATSSSRSDVVLTRKLTFVANEQLVEIDLGNDRIAINGNPTPMLPLQVGDVTISRDLDVLSIQSSNEFSLHCNVQFGLCWLELGGWYFGKTAGLLGTMNNEIFDEYMKSNNLIAKNVEQFTDSWSVQKCKQKKKKNLESTAAAVTQSSQRVIDICHLFFKSGMLSACAGTVDAAPFYEMCLDLGVNSNPIQPGHPAVKGACTAALAYIEACTAAKVPLRVPDQCVFCHLSNGSYVPEATFIELRGSEVPRSSDVVFIVEAKLCNANLTENKHLATVLTKIEEELQANRITNNNYAVVAFGGLTPFDRSRTIVHENRVFTSNLNELQRYFAHIEVGNGTNSDILQAISTASRLNFRPGVSKTFILLSCSDCSSRSMRFDYTSILQYMLEEGVNLHILADVEFDFERTHKLRNFFGLDRELVYSRRFMEGNGKSRKQLHISRSDLGICTPLALETNGSVFSARKLLPDKKAKVNVVQFATIFAKRVAKSAVPIANQTCECSGHNTGVAYMSCSPAVYPDDNLSIEDYDMQFNSWDWEDNIEDGKDFEA